MTDAERAKLVQDEGFLVRMKDRAAARLFNRWMNESDPVAREQLWSTAQALHAVAAEIAAAANELRGRG